MITIRGSCTCHLPLLPFRSPFHPFPFSHSVDTTLYKKHSANELPQTDVGNRKDSSEAIEFFRRGLIKAPYKVVGLSELQMVYDLMHKGAIAGRYVVDTSK